MKSCRLTIILLALAPLTGSGSPGADRAMMGMSIAPLGDSLCDEWDAGDVSGIEYGVVVYVTANSPADRAGLKTGDVLIRLNGKDIREPAQVLELVSQARAGQAFSAVVVRDGIEVDVGGIFGAFDPEFFRRTHN